MSNETPAYLIGNYEVTDGASIATYSQKAAPIVAAFGGRMIALDRGLAVLEGSAASVLVILQFPNMEQATAFYNSSDYTAIKHLRTDATDGGYLALSTGLPG